MSSKYSKCEAKNTSERNKCKIFIENLSCSQCTWIRENNTKGRMYCLLSNLFNEVSIKSESFVKDECELEEIVTLLFKYRETYRDMRCEK